MKAIYVRVFRFAVDESISHNMKDLCVFSRMRGNVKDAIQVTTMPKNYIDAGLFARNAQKKYSGSTLNELSLNTNGLKLGFSYNLEYQPWFETRSPP